MSTFLYALYAIVSLLTGSDLPMSLETWDAPEPGVVAEEGAPVDCLETWEAPEPGVVASQEQSRR